MTDREALDRWTGTFVDAAWEQRYWAATSPGRRQALGWVIKVGSAGFVGALLSDASVARTLAEFGRYATQRMLLLAVLIGLLRWAITLDASRRAAPVLALTEVLLALGFLGIRISYGGHGSPGAFLLSCSMVLLAVFFFLPSLWRWQVGTAGVVSLVALVGGYVALGRSWGELTVPAVTYGVITLVGAWQVRQNNADGRRLFMQTRYAEASADAAREAQRTARRLFQAAPVPLLHTDAEITELRMYNTAFAQRLPAVAEAEAPLALLFDARQRAAIAKAAASGESTALELVAAGVPHELLVRVERIGFGDTPGLLISLVDIGAHKARERQLSELAAKDPLTGALNRRGFDEVLALRMSAANAGEPFALLLLDVDRFKQVNDERGHAEGDRVLQGVVDAMSGMVRAGDVIARLGGDEFAVVLTRVDLRQAEEVAGRLTRLVARDTAATLSIGAAIHRAGESVAALMARADRRLYAVKGRGGDGVEAEGTGLR